MVNRGRKTIFWDAEIEKERQNKKQLFLKWLSTKDDNDKVQYKRAQAKIRRMVTNFRNELWDKKCLEIQSYLGSKKSSECWKFIKNVRSSNGGKSQFNLISADTWEKYYSKLLIEDCKEFLGKTERLLEDDIENATEIDSKTIKQIIMRMKNGRAAGPGDIPIELIKSGRQKLLEMITILLNKIINGEKVPEEWKVAIITSIHKKGDKRECKNYRGISVINTFSRIYGKILAKLIESEYKKMEMEEQSGFRAGRSCIDNIFCTAQMIEKKKAANRELHLLLIDLTKACDSVPLNKLWETLEGVYINAQLINAIKALYKGSSSKIKAGNQITKGFKVTEGLRQGCSLLPTIFKIYMGRVLWDWKRKCQPMGIPVQNTYIYSLNFADDQILLTQDHNDMEYMARKLKEEYEKWGLTINLEKTKYVCI